MSFEQPSEHRPSSRTDNPPIGAVLGFGQSAHCVYVSDSLGGMSTVSQYGIGVGGGLSPYIPATVAAVGYPLGVAVTPNGKSVYGTNEFDKSVSQYDVNPATGLLSPKMPATVAAGRERSGWRSRRMASTPT